MSIPRPEYPRPQLVRKDWINLNGVWEFEKDTANTGRERQLFKAEHLSGEIVVPFCPECKLSGIGEREFVTSVWYRRTFTVPDEWRKPGRRTLINFGACDYQTEVYINGWGVGSHLGGMASFSVDITDSLIDGENTVIVLAMDDTRNPTQPSGKQCHCYYSGGAHYSRTTGIWQTVWLENVPMAHIVRGKYTPDLENETIHIELNCKWAHGKKVAAKVSFEGKEMGEAEATVNNSTALMDIKLNELHLWDIGKPNLYDLELTLEEDKVTSYFGMRSVDFHDRKFRLNGKKVFQRLILDQGFYPDGLMTAPSDEELQNDIKRSMAIKQFVWSFTTDYAAVGKTSDDCDTEITVWQSSGRDQAMVLKQLINSEFTPKNSIGVNLELVSANSLMTAILAGIGPDISLGVGQDTPMNLALRNSVADLNQFEDIKEVSKSFSENTLESFRFNGGLYALPETITYPVLFYRKDIVKELNINVSDLETWEKILQNVLPTLQKSSLSFGIMPSLNNYLMFLYQNGGTLYLDNGLKSGLATSQAINAMKDYSMLYTQYGLSLAFDFSNRFRSGELPIAVTEFTAYNQLTVFAPEIRGLWGMLPVPGVTMSDGNVNHKSAATLSADIILEQADEKDACWTFLKWWLSAEIQSTYGKLIEGIVGSAARYNSANAEAFATVQWDSDVRQSLLYQRENINGTPEVPGGYFTTRLYDFAFRDIVYDGEDVRETLSNTAINIDREMQTKREEYGLN